MKKSIKARILSAALTCAMLLTSPVAMVKAAAEDTGKYISEVFIAYGNTEDEAKSWLTSHGWEPVEGNFNAGKDDRVAAVMGVKRTSDPNNAVTDMAVMNMGTESYMGYSFDDYQSLLKEKKADIDELLDCFMPAIHEYRDNYNGKGSESGKARAQLVHDVLNRVYDGEIEGQYAANDTGMPLGDLFLNTTRRELGEDKYDALSKNEQVKYGDLQQIILEGSGAAVTMIEQALALATDTNEDTWLDRLEDMSYLDMKDLAELYADGSSSLTKSAAESLLMSKYGDTAEEMANEFAAIQMDLLWYNDYCNGKPLIQGDKSDEEFAAAFEAMVQESKAKGGETDRFLEVAVLTALLSSVDYSGEWGDTLYDFFLYDDADHDYGDDPSMFLPFAAALSDGQRAAKEFLSLRGLLRVGVDDEAAINEVRSDADALFGELETFSVYAGINRAIFRNGVALTSRALMEKSRGLSPYDQIIDSHILYGIAGIMLFSGIMTMFVGKCVLTSAVSAVQAQNGAALDLLNQELRGLTNALNDKAWLNRYAGEGAINSYNVGIKNCKDEIAKLSSTGKMGILGRSLMALGGLIMIGAAALTAYQIYKYFNRTFAPIPLYIVDEADIVSYSTGRDGNEVKNIDFDQFLYYEVVKCNRQDIGINSHAQDGVDQYAEWGCGDAADLNCDLGKQWLALYTVKSSAKGNPILANSLKLQTGSDAMPSGCTAPLHFFTYSYAVDLGDKAYAYDNKMDGVYLFWDTDANAFTASTFTSGQLALVGIGGLAAGIFGATIVMMVTKKRKDVPETPTVA